MEKENYPHSSSHPESGHSSPRSREIEFENPPPWEDTQGAQRPQNYSVKFMCSYGGKILPRPHDNQLSYVGGETKILSVDRSVRFGAMLLKLTALCDCDAITFKYQLPGEDLDALISVSNDDDLENMMHEYDRLCRVSPKSARLRLFIFPSLNSSDPSFGSDEARMDKERFVEALNSATPTPVPPAAVPQQQPPVTSMDFLLGFEKSNVTAGVTPAHRPMVGRVQEFEDPVVMPGIDEKLIGSDPIQKHIQDLRRLTIEEQQGLYRRKSDDNLSGGSTGVEYGRMPEKLSQASVPGGIPYRTEKQIPVGVFPASTIGNEQQVYMIPAPAGAYNTPAPMVRPVSGAPAQGYYTVQRPSAEVYLDQQQIYNMINPQAAIPSMAAAIPSLPPQKVAGYSEGYGLVRPATTGGAGYAQVAYDGSAGRQVVYSAPGGVMGQPAQYHGMAADPRQAAEGGGRTAVRSTQGSV